MGKITLILGGARSGKSTHALRLAKEYTDVAFIATCQAHDEEMAKRIKSHKKIRPSHWKTYEEAKDLSPVLQRIGNKFGCIIIDCLTLFVSNLMLGRCSQAEIIKQTKAMLANARKIKASVILVSNEVGLGIVPDNKLARDFRDIAGKINQVATREANEVLFIVSGLPLKVK